MAADSQGQHRSRDGGGDNHSRGGTSCGGWWGYGENAWHNNLHWNSHIPDWDNTDWQTTAVAVLGDTHEVLPVGTVAKVAARLLLKPGLQSQVHSSLGPLPAYKKIALGPGPKSFNNMFHLERKMPACCFFQG